MGILILLVSFLNVSVLSAQASEIDRRLIHEISVNMKPDRAELAEYFYFQYRSALNQAADEAGIEPSPDWVSRVLELGSTQTKWIRAPRRNLKHQIGSAVLQKIDTELPRIQGVGLRDGFAEYRYGPMIDHSLDTHSLVPFKVSKDSQSVSTAPGKRVEQW